MGKSCSDYEATKRVPNEGTPCQACDWAELLYVVFNFGGQSFAHLHNVSFSLILITLTTEKDAIRMKNRQIVFKQSHVN